MAKGLFYLSLILALLICHSSALAYTHSSDQERSAVFDSIKYESVNPGSPYYIFKRAGEAIQLAFPFQTREQRAKLSSVLLDRRLKELAYTVKNNNLNILENASRRYTNLAGLIISSYPGTDPNIQKEATDFIPTLEVLRDTYHSNSAYWIMIQECLDTTNQLASIH